jgi:HAMP domain-containing protein
MKLRNDGDLVKALGYLVLYAAYVEEAIDECIDVFRKNYPDIDKQMARQTAKQKIKFIQNHLETNPPSEELIQSHFPSLLKYLVGLFDARNEIIHGRIYGSLRLSEADTLIPGRPESKERAIAAEEIYALANEFFSMLNSLKQASLHSLHRYLK